jgi:Bacterial protein of unknown function (DUF924)
LGDDGVWVVPAPVPPIGSLVLLILLDQFPRNAFRGSPRMYTTDAMARAISCAAIEVGHDRAVDQDLQLFFYLPFGHSEDLADQERSVSLCRRLGEPDFTHAKRHCDIVRRFGRFPHRNPILKRAMSQEEPPPATYSKVLRRLVVRLRAECHALISSRFLAEVVMGWSFHECWDRSLIALPPG